MWFNYQVTEEHRQKSSTKKETPAPPAPPTTSASNSSSEQSQIDRVDSSAMQSLAAYDSDEEILSPTSGRRRRSSEAKNRDKSPEDESAFGLGGSDFLVPKRIVESRVTENPEAPPSREGSAEIVEKSEKVEEFSPEEAAAPKRHLAEEDKEFSDDDEGALQEPPPPSRPQFYASPSPAPGAGLRSETQSPAVKKPQERLGIQPVSSAVSLVSYGGGEEEDMDQSRSSAQLELPETASAPLDANDEQVSAETSPQDRGKDSAEAEQEMDVDAYLEKAFEGKPVTEWSTESEGGDSPASGDMANPQEILIPQPPKQPCSQQLIDRFHTYFKQKAKGMDFNKMFQRRKDFRNPSIYEKLIEHFGIDEMGSNFPKSVFDPHGFKSSDYYDKLAEAQKIAMDKLEKEKRHKPTAETAEKKQTVSASVLTESMKSRKSKWDNPGAGSGSHHAASKSSSEPKKAKIK